MIRSEYNIIKKYATVVSVVTVLSFLLSVACFAVEEISWDNLKTAVLTNNLNIGIAKLKLDNAEQNYNKSLSLCYSPKIFFETNHDISINTRYDNRHSNFFSFPIQIFNLSAYADTKIARINLKNENSVYKITVSNVLSKTREVYIALIYSYENIKLLNEIRLRMCKNRDLIALKYKSGFADLVAFKKSNVDILKVENEIRKFERQIKIISATLCDFINEAEVKVYKPLEHFTKQKLISEPNYDNLISDLPEFLSAKYKLDTCKAKQLKIKSEWLPALSVSFVTPYKSIMHPIDLKHSEFKISASYPIFTGLSRIMDKKIAANDLKSAEKELKNISDNLKEEARSCYNDIVDMYNEIKINSEYLNVLKLQSEVSFKKYLNAMATYDNWYYNEDDYINCQIKIIDGMRKFYLAMARWNGLICESALI
jgi:outer membrane protein TolC